ncbi:helicase [Flavobacterium phage FPSV-S1]|nr:helicase [Flavobacterium phage FPSV-S1]QCW20506.1 helicase [Flavobacterium phage FPSV-S8]
MNLRPYQITAKNETREEFSRGNKRVILCKPTGSGKTVTFADIARETVLRGGAVMVVVDRKELLDQAREKLISYGLLPQIITAGKTVRLGANCYVATVQTLIKRTFPRIDLLIIDEAHKQIFDKILARPEYLDVYTIGATATPKRSGKMNQLSNFYQALIEPVTISELISEGFLVPAITFGAKVDTTKIKTKGEDFDTSDMYNVFDKATLYAGVVDKYQKYGANTKAICFCINVEHSKKTAAAFNAAGISAVHLDGSIAKKERESILKAFSAGMFQVITNVEVLTTGYDEWTIETVIVNLATKSLPKWLQMAGRGSRITPDKFKDKEGYLQKTHFNLIDMGGNVYSLGFWEAEREYSLTHTRKDTLDTAPVKECPEDEKDINGLSGCGALLHLSAVKCKCGYIFPLKKKEEPKEVEFIQLENYDFLPPELVGKSWGTMTIEELIQVQENKKYKQGWIIKQILLNKDLNLIDYAKIKGYNYPEAWVARMERMYIKQPQQI